MPRPFSDLPVIMGRLQRRVERGVTRITKEAARAAHKTAVLSTRADTGAARSNYVATIGSPNTGIIPAYSPGMKLGRGEQGNAQGAINQGKGVISGWSIGSGSIFIANNLPYIGALNDGSPTTSADMMAEKAAQAGTLAVRTGFRRAIRGR